MNWRVTMTAVGAMTLAFTLSIQSADAQTIRTFGDVDSGGTTVRYAGAPQPAAAAPSAAEAATEPAADGARSEQVGSYQIGLYGANNSRSPKAQQSEVFRREPAELYQGIIPGVRDALPHLTRSAHQVGSATPLTWVGFQAEETRTRVFFQSPRPLNYQVRKAQDGRDLIVVFENTRITERNFSRFIDASFFDRAVRRIEASEKRGGIVEVRLTMNEDVSPKVSVEGEYLYLDFAHQPQSAD